MPNVIAGWGNKNASKISANLSLTYFDAPFVKPPLNVRNGPFLELTPTLLIVDSPCLARLQELDLTAPGTASGGAY